MIDKPLYGNPLAGGQQGPLDLSKINKNPYNSEFIGLGEDQTNLFGYKVPDYVILKNNSDLIVGHNPPTQSVFLLGTKEINSVR